LSHHRPQPFCIRAFSKNVGTSIP